MSGSLPTNQDLAEDAVIRKDRKWDFIQKVSYTGSPGLCLMRLGSGKEIKRKIFRSR